MSQQGSGRVEQLYRAHAPACLGYARALCDGRADLAEDLLHDVFVKLLRRGEWPPDAAIRAYLLGAIRNAAANLRRNDARRGERLRRLAEQRPMFDLPADAGETGPADLGEWMNRLPDEQREAVYLKIWGELTFAQIAELTGVPLQTAASRFRYGLARLAEWMEPEREG